MLTSIRTGLSTLALSTVLAGGLCLGMAGCSFDDSSSWHHDHYGSLDRSDYDRAKEASERRGENNTIRSDIADDGRLNGSARSYDERKASRAADEGDYDAARREAELRRERLDH